MGRQRRTTLKALSTDYLHFAVRIMARSRNPTDQVLAPMRKRPPGSPLAVALLVFGKAADLARECERLLFTAKWRDLMDECTFDQGEVPGIGVPSCSVLAK